MGWQTLLSESSRQKYLQQRSQELERLVQQEKRFKVSAALRAELDRVRKELADLDERIRLETSESEPKAS